MSAGHRVLPCLASTTSILHTLHTWIHIHYYIHTNTRTHSPCRLIYAEIHFYSIIYHYLFHTYKYVHTYIHIYILYTKKRSLSIEKLCIHIIVMILLIIVLQRFMRITIPTTSSERKKISSTTCLSHWKYFHIHITYLFWLSDQTWSDHKFSWVPTIVASTTSDRS